MLKEINIRDFYLLASKKECSRYVIFLANQLNKTFRSLSFAPARGPAGVLFFQPIDILQKPTKEQEAERQSLCVFLSYFYVRIFQIYGSLALTLIDDANVYVKFKSGAEEPKGFRTEDAKPYGAVGAPNPLPGRWGLRGEPLEREGPIYPYEPGRDPLFRLPRDRMTRRRERDPYGRDRDRDLYRDRDRDRDLYRYRGGALLPDSELGRFKFLHRRLEDQPIRVRLVEDVDYKKNIGYRFVSGIDGTFKLKSDEFRTDKSRINEGSLFLQTPSRSRGRFYEVKLEVVSSDRGQVLRVVGVRYEGLMDEAMASRRFGATRTGRSDLDSYRLRDLMDRAFGREIEIVQSGEDYKIDSSYGQQSVSEFIKTLKSQFDSALGFRRTSDRDRDRYDRDRYDRRDTRVVGEVDPNLKLVDTLSYLQEKRPLGHCIARGLQLLGNKNPDGTFTPAVCETKFLIGKQDYDEKVVSRSDVPDPGGKILTGGIKSLSGLFYDTLVFKNNKLIRSNRAINDYVVFMQKMADVFLDPSASATNDIKKTLINVAAAPMQERATQINHPDFLKLENINDTQMQALCSGLNIQRMNPKSSEGQAVLNVVGKLFSRQIQHAANCGSILKQLFSTINVNGILSIRINKNVFIRGVAELNRINDLTRQLLIKYYSDCEGLYKAGVKIVRVGMERKEALEKKEPEGEGDIRRGGSTQKAPRTFEVA